MIEDEGTWLDTDEACNYVHVDRKTLAKYVSQRRLIKYRKGFSRKDWYSRAELDDLLQMRPVDIRQQDKEKSS